jgi:hypothetical protein
VSTTDGPVRIGAVTVTDQPDAWPGAIANGYGIALAPASAARFYARPGITYRPVSGISPTRVGVAWSPEDDTDPVVRDFVRSCLAARTDPPDAPEPDDGWRVAYDLEPDDGRRTTAGTTVRSRTAGGGGTTGRPPPGPAARTEPPRPAIPR